MNDTRKIPDEPDDRFGDLFGWECEFCGDVMDSESEEDGDLECDSCGHVTENPDFDPRYTWTCPDCGEVNEEETSDNGWYDCGICRKESYIVHP